MVGQHFLSMPENYLHNHTFNFYYTDNIKTYKNGDYLRGTNIPVYYMQIPG